MVSLVKKYKNKNSKMNKFLFILFLTTVIAEDPKENLTTRVLEDNEPTTELPNIKLKTDCNACHLRDELKSESLETIKAHVLHKLGFFDQIPVMNRTQLPKIPQEIYENYYNKSGYSIKSTSRSPNDYEMLGDDPFTPGAVVVDEDDDYFPITDSIYAFPTRKFCFFFEFQFFFLPFLQYPIHQLF